MLKWKKRFSIDSPLPYSGSRHSIAPSSSFNAPTSILDSRRYSTAQNAPLVSLHGLKLPTSRRASSQNHEVRQFALSTALREVFEEKYGHTPVYGIPVTFRPPPPQLFWTTLLSVKLKSDGNVSVVESEEEAEISQKTGGHIQYAVPHFIKHVPPFWASEIGQTITLEAKVGGNPPPQVYWERDEEEIFEDDRFDTSETAAGLCRLTVSSITEKDVGSYCCIAESPMGLARSSCYVSFICDDEDDENM